MMEPFPPPEKIWSDEPYRWHVYALPRAEDVEFAALLRRSTQVAMEVAPQALVPVGRFAHATIEAISIPANQVPVEEIALFARDLGAAFVGLEPFTLTAGSAQATGAGVLLDLDGDHEGGPWTRLVALTGNAIERRFGARALRGSPPPPHVTALYCGASTDSAPIQSALRRKVRPAHAPFSVDAVWVLKVHQNVDARTYTWPQATAVKIPMSRFE